MDGERDSDSPRLVVVSPAEMAGLTMVLSRAELVIGHSDTADLVLDDRFVSRRHALVSVDDTGQVTIRDLNSRGGTFVNDEPIDGARVLQPGDVVRFADLSARFEPGVPDDSAGTQEIPVPTAGAAAAGLATAGPPVAAQPPVADIPTPAGNSPVGGEPPATAVAPAPGTIYAVTGTALSPAVGGVAGLAVRLVDKNVGGDQLLVTTQTARDGSYGFSQSIADAYLAARYKTSPDFQVQVLAAGAVVAQSEVAYSAGTSVALDVVLPPTAPGLPSEYETLTGSLASAYPGSLGDLQEDGSQQDITYLANKTGWDARAVALTALADQFGQITAPAPLASTVPASTSQATTTLPVLTPGTQTPGSQPAGISAEFYYALFRAGLPADPDSLFRASPAMVQAIWEQAVTSGVIPQALAEEVPAAVARFQAISAGRSLDAPPPVGVSTLREMVSAILPEGVQQEQFAQLYAQYSGDWAAFWNAAEPAFGATATAQLRLTGQLLYLTVNNQPLVTALHNAKKGAPLTSLLDLVGRGYYDPARWAPLIGASIPPQIPGANADEQAANYAQLLAAQVRIAYPTAVAGDQVQRKIFPVPGPADLAQQVAGFLTQHQADFAIGVEPVQAYLERTGLTQTPAAVVGAIKRLQRVYQLTPDDASMSVLLFHNLDSAFAITRYDSAGFVRAFASKVGGSDKAAAIHARASQVFATTLSVTVGYINARKTPGYGGSVPVQYGYAPPSAPPGFPVTAYPTLEDLFGSLDYCDCEDCNSILSPAAYLVDLLNYLDQPAPAGGGPNPLDVLLARRPDLQYLPLTCANTNTALPYIDVVNELLEYYIANGLNIAGYQGHDTGDTVTAAELAASPQYVNDAAYGILQTACFPPPLPFNRPLELLRFHLAGLGVGLPAAMTALRATDDLTDITTPTSYGWTDILLEQLGISRDEYKLFADPTATVQLSQLYGLPAGGNTLATLQSTSLQDFSRRLGVSYDDLVAIIQTRFINPNAALIPRIEQLGASFAALQALQQNPNSAAEFILGLPAGLDATQYSGASPTDYQAVVNWIINPQNYQRIMSIIVISDPSGTADDCSGAALRFRYANPDNTANQLSGTDFLKLIRFIRLWQKLAPLLGDPDDAVTIQQTDDILGALYPGADLPADTANPANDTANRALLDAGFTVLLPRTGVAFQVLNALSLTADTGLDQLLACWAPIGTTGANSLYASMFLSPALLQQDPGAQTATVSAIVNQGDQLTTKINGKGEIPAYTVAAGQTAAQVATAIAGAINSSAVSDPVSGDPIGARFQATTDSVDGVITIMAGFSLECSTSAGATETYTPIPGTPVSRSATAAGAVTPGDQLITEIDTVPVTYQVAAGDTPAMIASGVAAAVNAATEPDPYSGLPLNSLVVAYAAPGSPVVTFTAADAGAPFELACSLQSAGGGTYTAAAPTPACCTATIGGTITPGDVLVTTVNSVAVSNTATSATQATVAAGIAAAINAAVGIDQASQLPLNEEVQAASSGSVITVTAIDPATPVTLACSATSATATYAAAGPFAETATATVAGAIPPGTIFTTTINTIPLVYMAAPGDTPASIATAIAGAVNTAPAADPNTGQQLSTLVAATAAGGVVTLTGASPTTPFTLATAISAAGYTAGQATPPFADDGYGDFLTNDNPAQTIFGHEPTLCAACNLTSAEFALIASALGFGPSTPLTLPNVSALFRYGWLAHALGLSVLEFLLLRQWSGLDPFAPLDPSLTAPAQPPVLRFITLLNLIKAAGLTSNQALYLMWNQDVSGTATPPLATVTGLAAALAADFAAVEAQFALQTDPGGSIAQNLMTLVYGPTATATFFGLLNGTFTTSVSYSTPPGVSTLPAQVIAASSGLLSYDNLAKQLTFGGTLQAAMVTAINAAVEAYAPDAATLSAAVNSLATASQQAAAPFFATYPELLPLYTAYVASTASPQDKRTALLAAFLPVLKDKRKQEQALAAITATAGTDPSFAAALLQDPTILHADADVTLPAVSDLTAIENQGLSAAFYLGNDPTATPDQVIDVVPTLSYGPDGAQFPAGTGGGAIAAAWRGYLTVPQDGYYDINVSADPGAAIALQLGGVPVPLAGPTPGGLWTNQGPITLTAGTLVPVTLTARSVKTTLAVTWQSQGTGWQPIPAQYLYPLNLVTRLGDTYVRFLKAASLAADLSLTATELAYLGTATTFAVNTTAATVITAGSATFTPASMANIAVGSVLVIDDGAAQETVTVTAVTAASFTAVAAKGHDGATTPFSIISKSFPVIGQGWLNYLTGAGWLTGAAGQFGPDPATAAALTGVLTAVADFAVMKQALSPSDGRLLAVLQNPSAQLPVSPAAAQSQAAALPASGSALLSLTGWSLTSVNALLRRFFGSANPASLASVTNLRRLYDAYALVTSTGLAAPVLVSAITNAPTPTTVSALQSALRAQYSPADWLTVIASISNQARTAQRDALVAYILQQLGDGYVDALVPLTTVTANVTGDTHLTFAAPAQLTLGMGIQGPAVAPGTTVWTLSATATQVIVTLSTGLLAALPAGTDITFVPTDAVAVSTADDLYQLFLFDTQNQPAVLTSRIQLAVAVVQLFIERVVRNLEAQVSAADIDQALWAWMSRYTLWQVQRECFAFPENWLYPELRDDQSPFFKQMMSSLLQGDITDDAAASAYLTYLTSLEEVAKLEQCGLYYAPGSADADKTCYVVARTAGAHRKYYFRELAGGSWTPWSQVQVDCEDVPITPIVWNGRLFLFWLKILKQASPAINRLVSSAPNGAQDIASMQVGDLNTFTSQATGAVSGGSVQASAVLCWTEYYNGTWQPTKTSDVNLPTSIGTFDVSGSGSLESQRSLLQIVPAQVHDARSYYGSYFFQYSYPLPDGALLLAITHGGQNKFTGGFILHNTHSLPVRIDDIYVESSAGGGFIPWRSLVSLLTAPSPARLLTPSVGAPYTGGSGAGTFGISYYNGDVTTPPAYTEALFNFSWQPRYVDTQPWLASPWDAPFIYEDRRHVFYVETTESLQRIWTQPGFGITASAESTAIGKVAGTIPSLVLRQQVVAPTAKQIQAITAAVGSPAAIQHYLATSTDLTAALPTQLAISYNGQLITPVGSLAGVLPPATDDTTGK
jgi:ABC toxin N-terminal region/Neuraminidase-like domain/FHA domain/PA14 domain